MRIAITGVTGFIGTELATQALARGHRVTAFSRRAWTGAPYVPLADRHFLELPEQPEPKRPRKVQMTPRQLVRLEKENIRGVF